MTPGSCTSAFYLGRYNEKSESTRELRFAREREIELVPLLNIHRGSGLKYNGRVEAGSSKKSKIFPLCGIII